MVRLAYEFGHVTRLIHGFKAMDHPKIPASQKYIFIII